MKRLFISACLIVLALIVLGCTTKNVRYIIPAVIDEQGVVQESEKVIEYNEINFLSEDTVEGLWFQHDSTGVIVELNKVETTMDAAIKMVEFINTLKPIGL